MKKNMIHITAWVVACQVITGCSAIEGIFKAGVWSGVLLVVVIIAVIIFVISKAPKK